MVLWRLLLKSDPAPPKNFRTSLKSWYASLERPTVITTLGANIVQNLEDFSQLVLIASDRGDPISIRGLREMVFGRDLKLAERHLCKYFKAKGLDSNHVQFCFTVGEKNTEHCLPATKEGQRLFLGAGRETKDNKNKEPHTIFYLQELGYPEKFTLDYNEDKKEGGKPRDVYMLPPKLPQRPTR